MTYSPIDNIDRDKGKQQEPYINIELYSAGFFDGLMGLNAELPHFEDYWFGYQIGYREYCCGLLGVSIPVSETSSKKLTENQDFDDLKF